jgi:hypothetical protein
LAKEYINATANLGKQAACSKQSLRSWGKSVKIRR